MYKILVLFCFFFGIQTNAQKIQSYLGNITLQSNLKTIDANFKIEYQNADKDSISFLLNKEAKIDFIKINNKKIVFKELNDGTLPDAKKIIFANTFSDKFNLNISYQYSLEKIEFPTFKYNKNWIELSLYTAWFPINFDDANYSYDLTFSLPNNYEAISAGKSTKISKNRFRFENTKNFKDILVVISDKFQKFQSQNKKIDFYGIDLSKNLISQVSKTSQNIFDFYNQNFTNSDSEKLIVAINPYKHQMSYSRKGMISLSLKNDFVGQDQRTLAHEIAHLWWKNANFGTYEEWLNESFAEYSALIWTKKNLSVNEFAEVLSRYESANEKPTKISEVKPNDNNWFSTVYLKGAYILYQLNLEIGDEKMKNILQETYKQKISNTVDFFKILEKYTDKKTTENFRNKIL